MSQSGESPSDRLYRRLYRIPRAVNIKMGGPSVVDFSLTFTGGSMRPSGGRDSSILGSSVRFNEINGREFISDYILRLPPIPASMVPRETLEESVRRYTFDSALNPEDELSPQVEINDEGGVGDVVEYTPHILGGSQIDVEEFIEGIRSVMEAYEDDYFDSEEAQFSAPEDIVSDAADVLFETGMQDVTRTKTPGGTFEELNFKLPAPPDGEARSIPSNLAFDGDGLRSYTIRFPYEERAKEDVSDRGKKLVSEVSRQLNHEPTVRVPGTRGKMALHVEGRGLPDMTQVPDLRPLLDHLATTAAEGLFSGGGMSLSAPDMDRGEPFEYGDQKFLDSGDEILHTAFGEPEWSEYVTENDGLLWVRDGRRRTGVDYTEVRRYDREADEREETRETLREDAESRGIGVQSRTLNEFTSDTEYRRIQEHLRSARETAKQSPMYSSNPSEATQTAILATADEDLAETIQTIQSQARGSLPDEIVVYRGLDVDEGEFFSRASSGTIQDDGFQSASIDPDTAEGFGNVLLEITTDHGAFIRGASEYAGEDEVLLPAGQRYRIDDVDRDLGVVEATALGSFGFNIDASFIRDMMNEEDISYSEAVERVI